jgi:hypothetical protein
VPYGFVCREDLKSNGPFSEISLSIPHLEKSGTVETSTESPRTAIFAGEGIRYQVQLFLADLQLQNPYSQFVNLPSGIGGFWTPLPSKRSAGEAQAVTWSFKVAGTYTLQLLSHFSFQIHHRDVLYVAQRRMWAVPCRRFSIPFEGRPARPLHRPS